MLGLPGWFDLVISNVFYYLIGRAMLRSRDVNFDFVEYAEDGHDYTIFDTDEWQEREEIETAKSSSQIIQEAERQYKIARKARVAAERLKEQAQKEFGNAKRMQRECEKALEHSAAEIKKELEAARNENVQIKLELEKCRQQTNEKLIALNHALTEENNNLKLELRFIKRRSYVPATIIGRGTEKLRFRLKAAANEAVHERIRIATTITRNAQKAGLAKQSPYEKAGTIAAVNDLLTEKKSLLSERGGKAELNRMILDLIANGAIPAPDTPTQKTIDAWIDKFKKTEIN